MIDAQPSLEFIPPAFNPLIWQRSLSLLPLWLRYGQRITEVRVDNAEELIELYHQFHLGKTRFMWAFRHTSTVDPPCISQLLWNLLPKMVQQAGKTLAIVRTTPIATRS